MLVAGVPFCALVNLALWWIDLSGRRDHSPLWMKIGCTGLLGYVIYQIICGYFRIDRNLAEMRKAVGANNDDEMAAIFSCSPGSAKNTLSVRTAC